MGLEMKAFEEYWEVEEKILKEEYQIDHPTDQKLMLLDAFILREKRKAERRWKAALEWCLSEERNIGYSVPVVPTDIIRKELNGE